ncbi:MAG: hypothetical protein IT165_18445 [Bryobacterales bacterium]|nr:hypothetical protein [Bryobacterales bacterium]
MRAILLIALLSFKVCAQQPTPAPSTPGRQFEEERLQQLLQVRRVYIDRLIGSSADQIRDMLMTTLQTSKLFIVTENADRADAFLRGSADDEIFTDTFQSSEGINARANSGSGRGSGQSRKNSFGGVSIGDRESTRIRERKHEARASLRLVNKDGDLIWSTTKESNGAKFRGAAADVADKVTRQLLLDFDRALKSAAVRQP